MQDATKKLDTIAIENFRKYLRIPSVHPNVNYDDCVSFLRDYSKDLEISFNVYECQVKKPMVVLSWLGKEPNLPSVMLNSHMDVVPVIESNWVHKPFDADIDENGNVYARGAQDVKSLGIQYLEAIRRLKAEYYQPRRTVHVTFAPDEEVGGVLGMKLFVKSEHFRDLDVGFALDEGIPGETEYWVYNAEKTTKRVVVHCEGQGGHGSLLIDDTAGEKVSRFLTKFYAFRKDEKAKGDDAISVNLTIMQGGVQNNVIPSEFVLTFDTRLPPTADAKAFKEKINQWCDESGDGVWIEDFGDLALAPITNLDNNLFWLAFKKTVEEMKIPLKVLVLNASSDAVHLRGAGVSTLGFCPHLNTPNRAHRDNEYLNIDVLIHGIEAFCKIIPAISNV
ncbi:hypothetical protein RN001_011251 [Aquatica leii]|uniref:N-acyl-aliphatic-L-amino acid amidohydrolase n=1 Tax=Aquatica leii TaxID=1421715 RepID=A0AAN7SQQ1_9COLE|nr:hypothetical protein RN001_011251 [Aquatica leii]